MSPFFKNDTEAEIKKVLNRFMKGVLQRRLVEEPWDYEDYKIKLPFHVALVPEEIWKSAKFERSFVTSLGMIGWEDIARIIAHDKRGFAERNKTIEGSIGEKQLAKIQQILRELEHGKRKPDWKSEISEIRQVSKSGLIKVKVVADLYVEDTNLNKKFCFEIKSPKPNSDQTKVSKDKILQLLHLDNTKISGAYFALPFNPYGSKEDYDHPHPFRWFNMRKDESVLIGEEFWNLLGGEGTYESLIKVFEDVGKTYKEKIKKEYLGI